MDSQDPEAREGVNQLAARVTALEEALDAHRMLLGQLLYYLEKSGVPRAKIGVKIASTLRTHHDTKDKNRTANVVHEVLTLCEAFDEAEIIDFPRKDD